MASDEHSILSDTERQRRLDRLAVLFDDKTLIAFGHIAEKLDADNLEAFQQMADEHRKGRVIGEWVGRKWKLWLAIVGGFMATLAFRETATEFLTTYLVGLGKK